MPVMALRSTASVLDLIFQTGEAHHALEENLTEQGNVSEEEEQPAKETIMFICSYFSHSCHEDLFNVMAIMAVFHVLMVVNGFKINAKSSTIV